MFHIQNGLINASKEAGSEVNPDVSSPTHTTKLQQKHVTILWNGRKIKIFRNDAKK
jgi:hypothetical protein